MALLFACLAPLLNQKTCEDGDHACLVHYLMGCFLLPTLLTRNVWVFHTKQLSNSLQTPTGCPTSQFNSDTNYPELVQTPQVKGSVPHTDLQPLPMPIKRSQLPGYPQLLSHLATNQGSHNRFLGFDHLLQQLTELRGTPCLLLPDSYKVCK